MVVLHLGFDKRAQPIQNVANKIEPERRLLSSDSKAKRRTIKWKWRKKSAATDNKYYDVDLFSKQFFLRSVFFADSWLLYARSESTSIHGVMELTQDNVKKVLSQPFIDFIGEM